MLLNHEQENRTSAHPETHLNKDENIQIFRIAGIVSRQRPCHLPGSISWKNQQARHANKISGQLGIRIRNLFQHSTHLSQLGDPGSWYSTVLGNGEFGRPVSLTS